MTFDQFLLEWRANQNAGAVPPGSTQGRATFGGLVAAMLYEKMADNVALAHPLICQPCGYQPPARPD